MSEKSWMRSYTAAARQAFVPPLCPHCGSQRSEPRWEDDTDVDAGSSRTWLLVNVRCLDCGQWFTETE